MFKNQQPFGIPRLTAFVLTVLLMLGMGTIVTSTPAAAQSGGVSDIRIQQAIALPQDVIVVFGTMTVVAVAVLVAFGYIASHSSTNGDLDSTQSAPNARDDLELTDLDHVGESRADTLREAGYESVAEVHDAEQDALTVVDGFGAARVGRITASAATLLEQRDETGTVTDNATIAEEQGRENEDEDGADTTDEDERPRATVTFDPETASTPEDVDEENRPHEAEAGEHLRLRTILSIIFTGPGSDPSPDTTSAVEEDDHSTEKESTDAEPEPTTSSESGQGAIERARATVTTVFAGFCGRARMLCDRRALDLRAYGVNDEWAVLAFERGEGDSAVDHELLEELVYIGAVPIEVATDPTSVTQSDRESGNESRPETTFADHTDAHLPPNARVRVPRRSVEWLEIAAHAERPEAKRTVTLLRQALRATGASSPEGAIGRGQ